MDFLQIVTLFKWKAIKARGNVQVAFSTKQKLLLSVNTMGNTGTN